MTLDVSCFISVRVCVSCVFFAFCFFALCDTVFFLCGFLCLFSFSRCFLSVALSVFCLCVCVCCFLCVFSLSVILSLSLSLCVFSVLFLRVSMLPFSLFSGYPAFSSQIAFLSQDE